MLVAEENGGTISIDYFGEVLVEQMVEEEVREGLSFEVVSNLDFPSPLSTLFLSILSPMTIKTRLRQPTMTVCCSSLANTYHSLFTACIKFLLPQANHNILKIKWYIFASSAPFLHNIKYMTE